MDSKATNNVFNNLIMYISFKNCISKVVLHNL